MSTWVLPRVLTLCGFSLTVLVLLVVNRLMLTVVTLNRIRRIYVSKLMCNRRNRLPRKTRRARVPVFYLANNVLSRRRASVGHNLLSRSPRKAWAKFVLRVAEGNLLLCRLRGLNVRFELTCRRFALSLTCDSGVVWTSVCKLVRVRLVCNFSVNCRRVDKVPSRVRRKLMARLVVSFRQLLLRPTNRCADVVLCGLTSLNICFVVDAR